MISELASITEYHRFADKLRQRGFREVQGEEAVICRWQANDVVLDVMPTDPGVFGFGNEWYGPALRAAGDVELPSGRRIRMVTAPYFLATKLAAFNGRGCQDFMASHDMEDIVAVLDGRPEVEDELRQADSALRNHLAAAFRHLLDERDFIDALPGHLPGDPASQTRLPLLMNRLGAIARL